MAMSGTGVSDATKKLPVDQLQMRAFGGSDVAAVVEPGRNVYWPVAPSAPGADEGISQLVAEATSGGEVSWLFLLGGPGNGKSEAAAHLIKFPDVSPVNPDFIGIGKRHRRTYDFTVASSRATIRLVNDATIGSVEAGDNLLADLERAISERVHLVVNVNRGIVLTDVRRADGRSGEAASDVAAAMLRTLLEQDGFESSLAGWPANAQPETHSGGGQVGVHYLSQFSFTDRDQVFKVRIVRLDSCSLFENRPRVELEGSDQSGARWLTARPYEIGRLCDRSGRDGSPAMNLFGQLGEAVRLEAREPAATGQGWTRDVDWNPLCANIDSMRQVEVQRSLVRVFRAAELSENQRFSYREIWGLISLLYLGPARDSNDLAEVGDRIDRYAELKDAGDDHLEERLNILLELSKYRFSQAVFNVPSIAVDGKRKERPPRTPASGRLGLVDPWTDVIAGGGDGFSSGWAGPVLEAMERCLVGEVLSGLSDADGEVELGASPTGAIRALAENDKRFAAVVSGFDRELEQTLIRYGTHPAAKDGQAAKLIGWFASYLTRLYAMAHGIPAFAPAFDAWTEAWSMAASGFGLPDGLDHRLRSLLIPRIERVEPAGGWFVLPAFAPRADPLLEPPESPALVARFETAYLGLKAQARGERLLVELMYIQSRLVEFELDYLILREAMACGQGFTGRTELSAGSAPRLERARASLLSLASGASKWAVVRNSQLNRVLVPIQPRAGGSA